MNKSAQFQIFSKVTFTDKLLFTKHLSVMTKSAIPITESLDLLAQQTQSTKFKKVLNSVNSDVKNGSSLASALEKHPKVFEKFYTSMVATGEESGTLEENLLFLSKQLSKELSLRKKIQGAMFYPALILAAVTIMGGFISFFILPQLVDFFDAAASCVFYREEFQAGNTQFSLFLLVLNFFHSWIFHNQKQLRHFSERIAWESNLYGFN